MMMNALAATFGLAMLALAGAAAKGGTTPDDVRHGGGLYLPPPTQLSSDRGTNLEERRRGTAARVVEIAELTQDQVDRILSEREKYRNSASS